MPAEGYALTSQNGSPARNDWELLRPRAELAGAVRARTDRTQVVETIDAGGVAVGELNLNGVVTHRFGGAGAGLGLEHGQRNRSRSGTGVACEGGFFPALVITERAGAEVAQVHEIVMAGVAVRPGDVHARAGRDVH